MPNDDPRPPWELPDGPLTDDEINAARVETLRVVGATLTLLSATLDRLEVAVGINAKAARSVRRTAAVGLLLFVLLAATVAGAKAVMDDLNDQVVRNRQQGLVNRRATLCIGRGLELGVEDWDTDYLEKVCLLSDAEADFVLGFADDLPAPDADAPTTTVPDE